MLRENKFHTLKGSDGVTIRQEKYQHNPFKHWKEKLPLGDNDDFLIAMIPFVRNIAEFAGLEAAEASLTHFLHVKSDSQNLSVDNLQQLFGQVVTFPGGLSLPNPDRKVFDVLFGQADSACHKAEEEIELESKIVLSIAVRIKAEICMIKSINNENLVNSIKSNQTYKIFQKSIELGVLDNESTKCIKQVTLMTPENIHINSFMYEPLLDMSNHHLKRLYSRVCALGS